MEREVERARKGWRRATLAAAAGWQQATPCFLCAIGCSAAGGRKKAAGVTGGRVVAASRGDASVGPANEAATPSILLQKARHQTDRASRQLREARVAGRIPLQRSLSIPAACGPVCLLSLITHHHA